VEPEVTDDEKGKALFEKANQGWPEGPNKLKWETLSADNKYLWVQRATNKGAAH
jgi:hypothetical protein